MLAQAAVESASSLPAACGSESEVVSETAEGPNTSPISPLGPGSVLSPLGYSPHLPL